MTFRGVALANFDSAADYGIEYVCLRQGDSVVVQAVVDDWAYGSVNGSCLGWFPRNYVKPSVGSAVSVVGPAEGEVRPRGAHPGSSSSTGPDAAVGAAATRLEEAVREKSPWAHWDEHTEPEMRPQHHFGRIPIVIHLGDCLQLSPTANIGLVEDVNAKNEDGSYKSFEPPYAKAAPPVGDWPPGGNIELPADQVALLTPAEQALSRRLQETLVENARENAEQQRAEETANAKQQAAAHTEPEMLTSQQADAGALRSLVGDWTDQGNSHYSVQLDSHGSALATSCTVRTTRPSGQVKVTRGLIQVNGRGEIRWGHSHLLCIDGDDGKLFWKPDLVGSATANSFFWKRVPRTGTCDTA